MNSNNGRCLLSSVASAEDSPRISLNSSNGAADRSLRLSRSGLPAAAQEVGRRKEPVKETAEGAQTVQ